MTAEKKRLTQETQSAGKRRLNRVYVGEERRKEWEASKEKGLQLPVSPVCFRFSAASIPSVLSSSSTRAFPRPRFLRKRHSLVRLLEGRLVACELNTVPAVTEGLLPRARVGRPCEKPCVLCGHVCLRALGGK